MTINNFSCVNCGSTESLFGSPTIRDYEYGSSGQWRYRVCDKCKLAVLEPFPSIEELINAYPKEYHENNDVEIAGGFKSVLQNLFMYLYVRSFRAKLNNARVLDVGCGACNLLLYLKHQYNVDGVGLDFSEYAVQTGKDKGLLVHNTMLVDFEDEEKFDVIIMNNYIEHTLNPRDELMHAYRLLKPGGLITGLLPNFDSWDRLLMGKYWGGYHCPRHTYQFDAQLLETMLLEGGFQNASVKNELHGAHISIGISNYIGYKKLKLRDIKKENSKSLDFYRMPFFSLVTLLCTPVSMLFSLCGKNGALKFCATK